MLAKKQLEKMLEKLKRFENTLEMLVFEKIGELDVVQYETTQRLYQIPSTDCFKPCPKGTVWGEEEGFLWLQGTYCVPEAYDGKALYIYPKAGGYEGMLWVNERPFGIFAYKTAVNTHGNHYCNLLCQHAQQGTQLQVTLELYAGQFVMGCHPFEDSGLRDFTHRVESVDICVKNEEIAEFLFDLKVLNQTVASLETEHPRRADLLTALIKMHEVLYYDDAQVSKAVFLEGLRKAKPYMKEKLTQVNAASAPVVGLIGHSHMDTAWLWKVEETIKKCARTYANQMSLMAQYPEYTFIQSSACHSDMVRVHYPQLFAQIQEKVAEGQYEPNGGVWVECDCNIPSGEMMIRQFLWGQRFTQQYFGYTANTFWLPDTFGYSAALPQIMKGCGVDYFLTTKMAWNDTTNFPYTTFWWKGLDGSQVLTHFNKTHVWPDPETLLEFVVNGKKGHNMVQEKEVTNRRLISYGLGDGGGGPQFEMVEMARRIEDFDGVPKAQHTTVGQFMEELEASLFMPSTHTGELYLQLHRGTLTNQHTIKRNNRLAEIALHNLEWLTVKRAIQKKEAASDEKIRPLMETLLLNQFHDILPGTCIPPVHQRSIEETTAVIEKANNLIAEITTETCTEEMSGAVVSVQNSLSFVRQDVVYLNTKPGMRIKGAYRQQTVVNQQGAVLLAVGGVTVPSLGGANLQWEEGAIPQDPSPFSWADGVLETPFARVLFDENGFIASFFDKRMERELRGKGLPLNTFVMAEDVPAMWDNWDIDADTMLKFEPCGKRLQQEIVSNGAVEFRIRNVYAISEKSTIEQDVIFFADSPEVRFETMMHWQEAHRFLKTVFSTAIQTDVARQEIQYGYLKRSITRNNDEEKANFEVCNHKYTDLSESRCGVALLNDCKYGISVEEGEMALSLHKGGLRPDYLGDCGDHQCVYAFYPHDTGFHVSNTIQQGYLLNYPHIVGQGAVAETSFATVGADNIILETIKPCEDSEKAFIVRLYDAEGTYTNTTIHFGFPVEKIEETNMLEVPLSVLSTQASAKLVFHPFEIKTLKVHYRD